MSTPIESNTEALRTLLEAVNSLPSSGGSSGSISLNLSLVDDTTNEYIDSLTFNMFYMAENDREWHTDSLENCLVLDGVLRGTCVIFEYDPSDILALGDCTCSSGVQLVTSNGGIVVFYITDGSSASEEEIMIAVTQNGGFEKT